MSATIRIIHIGPPGEGDHLHRELYRLLQEQGRCCLAPSPNGNLKISMNDHYHRPKRKILQEAMKARGKNPEECIRQPDLDKYSEFDNVRDSFLAIGIDPQASGLRQCELDPPDCQSFDGSGN